MAGIKGRTRMIASVNELTGNTLCTEAVLAQERPSWTPYAIGVAAVVGGFIVGLSGLGVLGGAIIGGLVGVVFVVATTYLVIARVGDEVVVARSSKMSAKAVEILERHPAPLSATMSKGVLQTKLQFDGRTLMIARQFKNRLSAIIS